MAERPICEVCGKPEASWEDHEAALAPPDTLCWADSPQHTIDALREARADRDRLRALLAAYGRAVEEGNLCVSVTTPAGHPVLLRQLAAIEAEAAKWREWG
ncbi:MAG: hypothetical protein ACRC4O_03065 [Giesbergeria sp.]